MQLINTNVQKFNLIDTYLKKKHKLNGLNI
jgi:hypothetical protein